MLKVRYRKVWADLRMERGRLLLITVALLVSLLAVGGILGAWGILEREIAVNYLGTQPAHATLEMEADISPALLTRVRAWPSVQEAEAREVVQARAQVGHDWRPVLLFTIDDFSALRLNTFRRLSGSWPPPEGTVLLERTALTMAETEEGKSLTLKTPQGQPTSMLVTGVVHDPGLAPAWQERTVYAYATRQTVKALGETDGLRELRVRFREEPKTMNAAAEQAEGLAHGLVESGYPVHGVQIPPPRQHPHQIQMMTVMLLLVTFAVLALVLSSVLTATTLAAVLARQVREIGVMKTLGATTRQLALLYSVMVLLLAGGATGVAMPLALMVARAFALTVARMLNLELSSLSIPLWVFGVEAMAGILVPLAFASVPILRATRLPVRAALDQLGAASPSFLKRIAWLPPVGRNALRRPGRFALTITLLAVGGALFMTAQGVARSWERNLDKIYEARHYDVEIRFREPEGESTRAALLRVPGVKQVEFWGYSPAAFARAGHIDVVHTYPDKGHGSLSVLAPPPHTSLITLPMLAGRWLKDSDDRGIVLNHMAAAQSGGLRVGDFTTLSIDGKMAQFQILGVVEEVGSPAVAYILPRTFGKITGTGASVKLARVVTHATEPAERTQAIRAIEAELAHRGVGVQVAIPFSELRTAVGDHVVVLIRALLAMAIVMAVVGVIGLGSTLGVSVLERTKEIGVMKALGATRKRIFRLILGEAGFTAVISFGAAVLVSLPLTRGVESVIGKLGFLAPLPFVVAPMGMAVWMVLLGVATLGATWAPARRAAAMTVREALGEL